MKIKITDFGKRHFDKSFGGTKILDISVEDFETRINFDAIHKSIEFNIKNKCDTNLYDINTLISDGYADFCKLVVIENFTDARVGSMPITLENYQYLRSGYSARRDDELPVFSRWLELPLGKPKADYLMVVLYNKEQILKELKVEKAKKIKRLYDNQKGTNTDLNEEDFEKWKESNGWSKLEMDTVKFDADWGVVAILGQSHPGEEPMKPETMLRNALGIEEGGSGVKLDREAYLKSVEFWDKNATVK